MGFLSAASSIVRFHAPAPARLDREAICAQVNRRAFREHDEDGLPRAESFGWVAVHDPLVVTFEPHDLFFQQYLVLGFRHDRRVAPAKLVTLVRRRMEEDRKREQGLERLSRETRREIKEESRTDGHCLCSSFHNQLHTCSPLFRFPPASMYM